MVLLGEAVATSGVLEMLKSGAAVSVSVSEAFAVAGDALLAPSSVMLVLLTMLLTPAAAGLFTTTTNVADPLPPPPARLPTAIVHTVPPAAPFAHPVHAELPADTKVVAVGTVSVSTTPVAS